MPRRNNARIADHALRSKLDKYDVTADELVAAVGRRPDLVELGRWVNGQTARGSVRRFMAQKQGLNGAPRVAIERLGEDVLAFRSDRYADHTTDVQVASAYPTADEPLDQPEILGKVVRSILGEVVAPVADDPVRPVLDLVEAEVRTAMLRYRPLNSPHEGIAVIDEERDELWDHVKHNTGRSEAARSEAIQVAAMAIRYALDLTTS